MLLVIIAITVGLASIEGSKDVNNYNWREKEVAEAESIKSRLEEVDYSDESAESIIVTVDQVRLDLINYSLDKDIPLDLDTPWQFVYKSKSILNIIIIFIIVLSANIIYKEFAYGTIKPILIKPFSRSEVLLSKQLAVMLISVGLIVFQIVIATIVGFVMFGKNGAITIILSSLNDSVIEINVVKNIVSYYLFSLIKIALLSTVSMLIALFIKKSVLPILLGMLLWMGNSIFGSLFESYEQYKYTIFPNLDLTQYLYGNQVVIKNSTIQFSLLIIVIYFIIFQMISYYRFKHVDIR